MTLYRVRIGISHVAGKLVPETRLVNLTEAEAVKQTGKAKPRFAELFAQVPAH